MTLLSRCRIRSVSWVAIALGIGAQRAHASEIWVAPTYQQDVGGLGVASNVVWPVTPAGIVRLAWSVPADLQTFTSAKVALVPSSPGGASTLNVIICPAQNNGAVATGCVGPFQQGFTGVPNQLVEVEMGGLLTTHIGTPGSTYLAVLAYTTPTTTTDHIVGLRFAYVPTAANGTATLAANTFSGTQTAPLFSGAFSGNGSALTNLPFPNGAATLGTNTFTGTQTAPLFSGAFSGNGAGLTGLPFPVGAATLGANSYTGTQTIATGNLDLGVSTATAGNLTKNGSLFLHNFGTNNTFLGIGAGNTSTTGFGFNTAVGASALSSNGTGTQNVAIGFEALHGNVSGQSNTAVGRDALVSNGIGNENVAVGVQALEFNTSGSGNIAIGVNSLAFNANGSSNLAIGPAAALRTTSGNGNIALGYQALFSNTTGSFNLGLGVNAGDHNTSGSNNIYLGDLVVGVDGESNTMYLGNSNPSFPTINRSFIAGVRGTATGNADAVPVVIDSNGQLGTVAPNGIATLASNTFSGTQVAPLFSGSFSGDGSGLTNLSGLNNTGVTPGTYGGTLAEPVFTVDGKGRLTAASTQALPVGTTSGTLAAGNDPRFSDARAPLPGSVSYIQNTTSAQSASFNITGAGTINGSLDIGGDVTKSGALYIHTSGDNTFLGVAAGNLTATGSSNSGFGQNVLHSNATGFANTGVGSGALLQNVGGGNNTAVGAFALIANTNGGNNTAVGASALATNSSGSNNIAVGWDALTQNTTGIGNIALGVAASGANSDGRFNVAIGDQALSGNQLGSGNVAIGWNAGTLSNGFNNIYLGANVFGVAGEQRTMYLGNQNSANGTTIATTYVAGVRGVTTGSANAIPVVIDSNGQLGTISSSRRFKEDIHDMADASRRVFDLRPVTFHYTKPYATGAKPLQFGLVAEEVATAFPELAVRGADGQIETVHYETLSVLLLNEVQRQERTLIEQQHRIETLERRLNNLLSAAAGVTNGGRPNNEQ